MSTHFTCTESRSLARERAGRAAGWRLRGAVTVALTVLVFAVNVGAASAQTAIVAPDAAQQTFFQAWVNQSLVPTPDARVNVTGTICPGGRYMACSTYSPVQPTIAFPDVGYLFAAPYTDDTVDQTRSHLEFMHEVGHVFDWTQSSRTDPAHGGLLRPRFLRIMHITGSGVSDARWAVGQIGNLTVDPQELFAMGYSYCAAYATLPAAVMRDVFWGYGYTPDARQYTQVCALIKRAASASPVAGAARARSAGSPVSARPMTQP